MSWISDGFGDLGQGLPQFPSLGHEGIVVLFEIPGLLSRGVAERTVCTCVCVPMYVCVQDGSTG